MESPGGDDPRIAEIKFHDLSTLTQDLGFNYHTFKYQIRAVSDFYRTQVNLGSDLWVRMSVRHRGC